MVFIGNDHAGVKLKQIIIQYCKDHEIPFKDVGVHTNDKVDYPDIADLVCQEILKDIQNNQGILVCGSGIGMSIVANRYCDIRAALCTDSYMASVARRHNNANVLCLGERVIGVGVAQEVVATFLNEKFDGGRHDARVKKLTQIRSYNE